MKELEWCMAEWVPQPGAPELMCKDPELNAGEKWVITVFQDESSFHVNEFKQNIWCTPLS